MSIDILKGSMGIMAEETGDLTYQNLIQTFVNEFPEFETNSKEEIEFWRGEEPPVHVFFGNVLNPFLVEDLLAKEVHSKLLDRIFYFLERMAVSKDKKVQEVLGVAILERVGDDRKILKIARKIMLPETLKMSHEIENWVPREK